MFVFNLKFKKNTIFKVVIIAFILFSLLLLLLSIKKIYNTAISITTVNDSISNNKPIEITSR